MQLFGAIFMSLDVKLGVFGEWNWNFQILTSQMNLKFDSLMFQFFEMNFEFFSSFLFC
jgi:hypothetical protein